MKILQGDILDLDSIAMYRSAYELLDNEGFLRDAENVFVSEEWSHDFLLYLDHFDDFDPIVYFCINGSIIICADSCDNHVIATFCNVKDFLDVMKEQYIDSEQLEVKI